MLWELRIVAYGFSKAFFPPPASWVLEFADNLLGHAGGATSLRVRTEGVRRLRTPRLPIMPLAFAITLATPLPGCTQLSGLPSPRAQQTILWFAARIGSKSTVVPSQPDRTVTPCLVVPVRTYTRSCTIAASLRFPPDGWYQIQLPQHSYQVVVLRSQGRALGSRLVRKSPWQICPSPISPGCYIFFCRKHAFQFRSTRDLAFSTRTRLVFPSTSISASACCHHLNVNSCCLSLERDDGVAPSRHPRTVAHWRSPSCSSGCFAASRSAAQLPH